MSEQRPCKACRKLLTFARVFQNLDGQQKRNEKGEGIVVPLDTSAPIYQLVELGTTGELVAVQVRGFGVSHFATCPQASTFSRRGRA